MLWSLQSHLSWGSSLMSMFQVTRASLVPRKCPIPLELNFCSLEIFRVNANVLKALLEARIALISTSCFSSFLRLITSWRCPTRGACIPCPGRVAVSCLSSTFPPSRLQQRRPEKMLFPSLCFCAAELAWFPFLACLALTSLCCFSFPACRPSVGVSWAPPLSLAFPSLGHVLSADCMPALC